MRTSFNIRVHEVTLDQTQNRMNNISPVEHERMTLGLIRHNIHDKWKRRTMNVKRDRFCTDYWTISLSSIQDLHMFFKGSMLS
jgi:hypothetical protein